MQKVRICGILDTSSYGVTIGEMEMEISSEAVKRLLKLANNSVWMKGSLNEQGLTVLTLFKKSEIEGKEDTVYATYFIKKIGGKRFLNVTGNPTTLMAGRNDIPVLLSDKRYAAKGPLNTFKYANRILFAILESVPVDHGLVFEWPKEDRARLTEGMINISQLQMAWYSGNLADQRDDTLKLIREMYVGLKHTTGYALTDDLNIRTTPWSNNLNITFDCMSSANKELSLTLYAKDDEEKFKKYANQEDIKRVRSLIRFDCTFRNHFLKQEKINTVALMEKLYVECCTTGGYDTGFIKYLSDYVKHRLRLGYLMKLEHAKYLTNLDVMREIAKGKDKKADIAQCWLEDKLMEFKTQKQAAVYLEMTEKTLRAARVSLLKETGIDVDIPFSYHDQVLRNRADMILTKEEFHKFIDYKSNDWVSFSEQARRSDAFMKKITESFEGAGVLRIRKLAPRQMKAQNFYINQVFRGEQL